LKSSTWEEINECKENITPNPYGIDGLGVRASFKHGCVVKPPTAIFEFGRVGSTKKTESQEKMKLYSQEKMKRLF
jgi:hypothetical protein